MLFNGHDYERNQMREIRESDTDPAAPLQDWFRTSKTYEYTNTRITTITTFGIPQTALWQVMRTT